MARERPHRPGLTSARHVRRRRNPIIVSNDSREIASSAPPPLWELGGLVAATCAVTCAVTCAAAWTDLDPDEQVIV